MRRLIPRLAGGPTRGRVAAICVAVLLSAVAAGCDSGNSSDSSRPPTPQTAVARRVDVEIRDFSFNPASFEAPQARPFNITATNKGATRHTINVYKDAAFTLPLSADSHIEIEPGAVEGLFVKFDDVATYYFRCEIHPQQMQGQITVKPSF